MNADQKRPTLFDVQAVGNHWTSRLHAPARAGSPPQVEAAARLKQEVLGRQCQRILDVLAEHGPMTREEIVAVTGIKDCAACARLNALEHAGEIRKDGTKEAESGVQVSVYRRNEQRRDQRD